MKHFYAFSSRNLKKVSIKIWRYIRVIVKLLPKNAFGSSVHFHNRHFAKVPLK